MYQNKKKIQIVNLVFQKQQTSQELLLTKIIIQSRLVSLRVVQEDKTITLTEGVNKEGFCFFFKRKGGIFDKHVHTVRVVEFFDWKRLKRSSRQALKF